MDNRKSNNAWIWVVYIGAIGFLLGLLGCAGRLRVETQYRPSVIIGEFPSPMFPAEDTSRVATTTCDALNQPVIYLNPFWTKQTTKIEWWTPTLVHEYTHASDILALTEGCQAVQERATNDKDFRLQLEAHAYCVQFRFQAQRGDFTNNTLAFQRRFSFLYQLHGSHLSVSEFWSRIPCAEVQPIKNGGKNEHPP